jgi:general secretion pathway protein A
MVLNYYKLAEQPFGVTPDPRFLYSSPTHREAVASVLCGVQAQRGFTALIAEPGMGKTTLLFNLLRQLGGTAKTAFLFQAQDTAKNFLHNLLTDLGVENDGQDLASMQAKLNECLVRETSHGKSIVVVVDEAQSLDEPLLEVVRMLSNFETASEKLMHIVLAGQPQLATKLASSQMTQLRQRISIVARLKPFDAAETRAYIEHRLKIAGYRQQEPLFTNRAYELIAEYSGGIPRNINNICFNAMLIGCATQRRAINAPVIEEVLGDLNLAPFGARAPVAEYQTASVTTPVRRLREPGAVFPTGWRLRPGLAALIALLAVIGLTVMAKNPHSTSAATVAIAPTVPTAPLLQPAAAAVLPEPAADPIPSADNAPILMKSASSAESTKVTAGTSSPDISAERVQKPSVKSVRVPVRPRDTLYAICREVVGRYDAEVVSKIRELNPGFGDPRAIKVGQELWIPTPEVLAAGSNLIAERSGTVSYSNTLAAEAKKP